MLTENRSTRPESAAFYILLVTVFLTPLAFWADQYFALEAVKTIVISLGTLSSLVCLFWASFRRREASLPPRPMVWIGLLIFISILASSLWSGYFSKSFFGQGFELEAGSFIVILMLAGFAAACLVSRKAERAMMLYAGIILPFLLLVLFQILRFAFGPGFATLGLLGSLSSTILGSWYSFAIYAVVANLVSSLALIFLPLSPRLKWAYRSVVVFSMALAFIINNTDVWIASSLIFLGLTIFLSLNGSRPRPEAPSSFVGRIVWWPLIIAVISVLLAWQGNTLSGPVVARMNAGYSELSLPWGMTLDVGVAEFKDSPWFGTGPDRFLQAFLTHKPDGINQTDAWGVEFNTGFGLIPTLMITQGLIGSILWALFLVFFGVLGTRSLRRLLIQGANGTGPVPAEQPYARFIVISSFAASTFLWVMAVIYVPSHAIMLITFVLTGIWLGSSVSYGLLDPFNIAPQPGTRYYRILPILALVGGVISILWAFIYVRNTAALAYFGGGVKQLTVVNNAAAADRDFRAAVSFNQLDVYWQGRVEANITGANTLIASVTSNTPASTSQAIAAATVAVVNQAFGYATNAIADDPTNYYNYLSEARVAELATQLNMTNGYETAVAAYTDAIKLNPNNPSLYLSLARLQASKNDYDKAIQTIGAALQVKNNYLDAVFLLSQVEAAKGNLPDAITAAAFATKLNTNSPILFFQLGLLEYTQGDYTSALTAFNQALVLQPTYANAQYFMGLSDARLGKVAAAINIFSSLVQANPGNSDVATILSTLRSGKPLFTGAASAVATPEKTAKPPLPTK